jgi:ADP-ribose pyrophosphatase YjhB (NUDIX family)
MGDDESTATRFESRVPDGDNRERLVCNSCGHIQYDNPKIVVGAVCDWEGRVLLCRRDIDPRIGFWTLPAGYLELEETPMEGALREAREEAEAEIEIDQLLAIYHVQRLSQVQLIYRARLLSAAVAAGQETQEVGLFAWDEIPWDDIAFPTVHWALRDWRALTGRDEFATRTNPEGENADRLALP